LLRIRLRPAPYVKVDTWIAFVGLEVMVLPGLDDHNVSGHKVLDSVIEAHPRFPLKDDEDLLVIMHVARRIGMGDETWRLEQHPPLCDELPWHYAAEDVPRIGVRQLVESVSLHSPLLLGVADPTGARRQRSLSSGGRAAAAVETLAKVL